MPQPFNYLADRGPFDRWRRRALTKFTPDEQCQLRAIGQCLGVFLSAKGLQQPVPRIFPEQCLYPVVHRDEMEVDGVAGVVAEAADVKPFGVQLCFNDALDVCHQATQLCECGFGQLRQ
ncbi:hypothetical protein D3C76_1150820 [compost metagenome]